MKKTTLLLSIVLIAGCATTPMPQAGISQFIETREGRRSVWGLDIQLASLSFAPSVSPDQVMIKEAKYGRDLRDMMEWSVSSDRKCLRIRFKPGMGDFGAGNVVTVHVKRSAIIGYTGINERFEWDMTTDIQ